MTFKPLDHPDNKTPERRENGKFCRNIRDLYWEQQNTNDPKRIAYIDRQLVGFLLKLAESDILIEEVGLKRLEIDIAKKRHRIHEKTKRKISVYAECFARDTFGD